MKRPSRISSLRRALPTQALLRRPTTRESPQSSPPKPPISRLPDELLVLILEFLQGDPQLYGDGPFHKWLRTSLVCRAWREIILNSPTLWSYIRISSYRQAEIMFERSCGAVIDVMSQVALPEGYSDPTPTNIMLSHLISDNLYRTRTLQLYGPMVDQFLSHAFPSSATNLLRELSLDTRGLQSAWPDGDVETHFSGACRLQVLELYGVFISPSASVFTANLTFLSLDSNQAVISGAYTINEMVGVLKRTSSLRNLFLRYWITDSRCGDPDDIAYLPELRTLQFIGHTLLQCALFTQRLSLPQTSAVDLHCGCETPSEAVSPLSSFPRLPGGITDPCYFMSLILNYDGSEIFIHASPYIICPGRDVRLLSGCLTLRIGIIHPTHQLDTDGIVQLLALLDVHAVLHLYLGLGADVSVTWSPILSFFYAVSEIHLSACAWQHFVQNLSMAVPYESFGESDATPRLHGAQDLCLLCPYLCKLQLCHPKDSPGPTIDPLFFESLAIVLELRRASGVEVHVWLQGQCFSIAELRNFKVLKRNAVWKYVEQ